MTFEQLGLCPQIRKALDEMGYTAPTPIQEKAIPAGLQGRDVLGCAQTGTGKTCAFAAPILQRLSKEKCQGRPVRALILTPTRELALQIQENFVSYGKYLPLKSAVIFGGVGQGPQVEALKRGVDILTATPGRLADLHNQGLLELDRIEIFVLDEADRMLDMGFIHDVKKILQWLPEKKQTLFFSATMPEEITQLVNSLLRDPVKVAVNPISSPVEVIDQSVYFVDRENKTALLAKLIRNNDVKNALVFTRTKHGANKVARDLTRVGITAAAIHGNKSQTARQQALGDFKAGRVQILVATDIAARGIDIEELSHVFNYNLPEVPETYVHRIGRTGRAGRGGKAIALCDFGEKPLLKEIEKLMGKKVPAREDPEYPLQVLEAPKRDKHGRIVNAEDAQARAAAREKSRQRRQEKAADSAGEKAAEGKEKRRGETAPAKPTPAKPASGQEPKPRQDRKQPENQAEGSARKYPRPVLRPAADLEEFLKHADDPVMTDFVKPDPLAGDKIMDATARLFSTGRRSAAVQPERKSSGRSQAAKKKAAQPRQETHKPEEKAKAQSKQKSRKRPEKKKEAAASGSQKERNTAAAQKQSEEQAARPAPSSGTKRRRGRNTRPAPIPERPGRKKDSTENGSLMKPFYMKHD